MWARGGVGRFRVASFVVNEGTRSGQRSSGQSATAQSPNSGIESPLRSVDGRRKRARASSAGSKKERMEFNRAFARLGGFFGKLGERKVGKVAAGGHGPDERNKTAEVSSFVFEVQRVEGGRAELVRMEKTGRRRPRAPAAAPFPCRAAPKNGSQPAAGGAAWSRLRPHRSAAGTLWVGATGGSCAHQSRCATESDPRELGRASRRQGLDEHGRPQGPTRYDTGIGEDGGKWARLETDKFSHFDGE